jgi:hypothetical protein
VGRNYVPITAICGILSLLLANAITFAKIIPNQYRRELDDFLSSKRTGQSWLSTVSGIVEGFYPHTRRSSLAWRSLVFGVAATALSALVWAVLRPDQVRNCIINLRKGSWLDALVDVIFPTAFAVIISAVCLIKSLFVLRRAQAKLLSGPKVLVTDFVLFLILTAGGVSLVWISSWLIDYQIQPGYIQRNLVPGLAYDSVNHYDVPLGVWIYAAFVPSFWVFLYLFSIIVIRSQDWLGRFRPTSLDSLMFCLAILGTLVITAFKVATFVGSSFWKILH